jgi:hypothetical protein
LLVLLRSGSLFALNVNDTIPTNKNGTSAITVERQRRISGSGPAASLPLLHRNMRATPFPKPRQLWEKSFIDQQGVPEKSSINGYYP